MYIIDGTRLRLVNADSGILHQLLEGDAHLSAYLEVQVRPGWSAFGHQVFEYSLQQLEANPESVRWWTYLPIFKPENELIGSGGYKGPPDEQGIVELGYEIRPNCRNQGLATELTGLLVDHAFSDPAVQLVQAHTQGDENASCRVLLKNGFKKDIPMMDVKDGTIWRWKRTR